MKYLLKLLFIALIFYVHSMAVAEIRVRCMGQGSLVYLIGGGPAFSTWNLQPIQESLSKNYKACRWDMRGIGENRGLILESEKTALFQWIADMHEVLPQQPVVLWGHSWGALQVLLFAKTYPDRVSKLVLSNPLDPSLLSLEHIDRKLFSHAEIDAVLTLDDFGTATEKLHNFRSKIASYFVDTKQGWEYALQFSEKDSNSHLNVRIWQEYKKTPLVDADIKQLSNKISAMIHCRDDVLQPESLSEYQRLLDKSKHQILSGCVHFPWVENPNEYYQLLHGLLGQ